MANIRKLSAFRQLSLNCESPKEKRKFLKKQLSEDLSEANELIEKRSNFKQQFDNKGNNKIKNRPIKIAWDNEPLLKDEEPVIVKKCKEIKRPVTTKLTKQTSIEKDSIFSKQNLAKRLRQVFETPEERKLNLNIFLTQNYQENPKDSDFNEVFSEIDSTTADCTTPKIRPPLLTTNNNNADNLFQIRRNKHELIPCSPRSSPQPPKTVVVPVKETESSTNNDPKPIDNVIIRPNTAAMKRERFQKRTNSAFNATIKEEITIKPPLVRAVSAPTSKTDKSKSKFIASKRKIKTNRKKKIKEGSDDEINNNTIYDNSNNKGKEGILENLGNDVVTMVSLVSPSASDCEDSSILPIDKAPTKLKKDDLKTNKNLSLRKTIKSVSFQQSTIHAIRSFSASFPARRNNSMVVSNLSTNNRLKGPNLQEKRTTTHSTMMIDDGKEEHNDENSPKRKLLKDTQGENSINDDDNNNENSQKFNHKTNITVNITNKTTKQQINNEDDIQEKLDETPKINIDKNNQERNETVAESDGKKIKFGSVKEKECWEMFHKMTEKGIKVSYDAILRGMLTPTEYRLRNKEIVESQIEK